MIEMSVITLKIKLSAEHNDRVSSSVVYTHWRHDTSCDARRFVKLSMVVFEIQ
jgi:hypothetical protein